MKPMTERLLQAAAICALFYYGWLGVVQLVVSQYNGQMAQRGLAACQQELAQRPPLQPTPEKK